jgi:hypothetical protein
VADLEATINAQQELTRFRDIDSLDYDSQRKAYANERYKSDTRDRKWLAEWVVALVSIWLLFVLLILINKETLKLSDTVLVALLGTTTLNIIGLSAIVLRGHFKIEKGPDDPL